VAPTAQSSAFGEELAVRLSAWAAALSVVLADGEMFGAQVPVDVNRTQTLLVVRRLEGNVSNSHATGVTLSNVTAGLLNSISNSVDASPIGKITLTTASIGEIILNCLLLAVAGVGAAHRRLG